MAKDEHLVLACTLDYLLIADLIHEHHPLDGFFLRDTDVYLLKRNWAIALVEVVQACLGVDPQERGHVPVVRQSCTQSDDPDQLRGLLNLANSAADNGF